MAKRATSLQHLLDQQEQIQAAIREAKKKEAEQASIIEAERCRIIGAAVIAEMKTSPAFATTMDPIIERHTDSTKDRKALGLAPRPKSKTQAADAAK